MNTRNKITTPALFFCLLLAMVACRKMDDYKEKFLGNGAITYAGKIDSVKAHPGDGRLMISGLLIADPKITELRIYWNNKADSLVVPVTRTSGVDTIRAILNNMEEAVKSFTLVTFDKYGNKSVEVNVAGRVYGAVYKSLLLNRTVKLAEMAGDSVTIQWNVLDASTGALGSQLEFTDNSNATKKVYATRADTKTVLKNFKAGTKFSYRTVFLPDTLAIDTFYSSYQSIGVRAEVTAQYLKNPGPSFKSSDGGTDRWRIPADWIVSNDVKNAGGKGGLDAGSWLPGPSLSMEAGWGLPAVPNGKIYQTVTLPAGRYSFEFVTGDCDGGEKYVSVAKGTTLPDIANVATGTLAKDGFVKNATNVLRFELTEATQVSIGFQGKMPDTNTFFKVFSVKLFSLP